jgi:hypothetical protein
MLKKEATSTTKNSALQNAATMIPDRTAAARASGLEGFLIETATWNPAACRIVSTLGNGPDDTSRDVSRRVHDVGGLTPRFHDSSRPRSFAACKVK